MLFLSSLTAFSGFTKLTNFKNSIYLNICFNKLSNTILSFVENNNSLYLYPKLDKYKAAIELKESLLKNYKKINTFLDSIDINSPIIILNVKDINLTNMLYIKNLVNLTDSKIIIEINKSLYNEELESIYSFFDNLSLPLYDIYKNYDSITNMIKYLEAESIENYLFFEQSKNIEANLNHDVKILTKKR